MYAKPYQRHHKQQVEGDNARMQGANGSQAELSTAESRRNKILWFPYPLELLVSFLSKEDCILFPNQFVSITGTHINQATIPKRSRFISSLVLRLSSLPPQCVTTTAPPHQRGPGPRLTTSFEYNIRREVPTNLHAPPGCDTTYLIGITRNQQGYSNRGLRCIQSMVSNLFYFPTFFINLENAN
jgi:hypothetical protein